MSEKRKSERKVGTTTEQQFCKERNEKKIKVSLNTRATVVTVQSKLEIRSDKKGNKKALRGRAINSREKNRTIKLLTY